MMEKDTTKSNTQKNTTPTSDNNEAVTESINPIQKNINTVAESITPTSKNTNAVTESINPIQKNTNTVAENTTPTSKNTTPTTENADIIRENVLAIRENIGGSGREVLIVAATKMVDACRINELKKYGIFDAGENRTNELVQKYDKVEGIRWHFIGKLQRNKVKYIIDKVCLIHSVDSIALAEEINKRAAGICRVMDVLIEVNIGGETSKSGIPESQLDDLASHIFSLKNLKLKGLMTVLPINAPKELYKRMLFLYNKLKSTYEGIEYLSMGMSDDYAIAVQNGANLIRPGTAIFGKRNY